MNISFDQFPIYFIFYIFIFFHVLCDDYNNNNYSKHLYFAKVIIKETLNNILLSVS